VPSEPSEARLTPIHPATNPPTPLQVQRRHALRVVSGAVAVAAFALGFLVANLDGGDSVNAVARVAANASLTVAAVWLHEIRTVRRFADLKAQMDARLSQAEYAEGYVDGITRRPPGDDGRGHLRSV
jgi:hypothetical protein